ncbi:MAG: hypothetical protein DMF83_20920 [Acidobacteria bacterium]|nr:MAG: hypothetical protein DMF83_20920 [Acidobacteriota bacterium]
MSTTFLFTLSRIDELVATLRRLESLGRERTTVGAASEPCAVERPAVPDSLVTVPEAAEGSFPI